MARTATARTVIVRAFRLVGITAQGEEPTADEMIDGLASLNDLIDAWATHKLTAPTITRSVVSLTANVGSYTIGPAVVAPNFVLPRPETIEDVALLLTNSAPNTEIGLTRLNQPAYQGVPQKAQTATQPHSWYFSATMPAATIELFPIPTSADNDLVLYTSSPFSQYAAISTSAALAPGYMRALRYNLAVELAPEYGVQVDPQIRLTAADALGDVKRQNLQMVDLETPRGLIGRGGYDIQSDRHY